MDAVRELAAIATAFRPQYGPQSLPPEQVLSMVTSDAAKALGMGDELGTLEPGKRADIVIIDPGRDLFAQPGAHTNPYCRLVYEASAQDVFCTIIDGRIVYQDGRVLVCDENALAEQANTELVRILEKA